MAPHASIASVIIKHRYCSHIPHVCMSCAQQVAEVGDGVLGTLATSQSHKRGSIRIAQVLNASAPASAQPKEVCASFNIARPTTSCVKGDACGFLHVKKCQTDRSAFGGGMCPNNSLAGCKRDPETGRIVALGPKTCTLYHFRPVQKCQQVFVNGSGDPKACPYGDNCLFLHVEPSRLGEWWAAEGIGDW